MTDSASARRNIKAVRCRGLRRPFEGHAQQLGERRRDPWHRGGGGAFYHDEGRHRARPAPSGHPIAAPAEAESRAGVPRVGGNQLPPPQQHPAGDFERRRGKRGPEGPRGQRRHLSVEIGGEHPAGGRLEPFDGQGDHLLADDRGIERLVGGAHHRQHGLGTAEPSFERALTAAQPLRQVHAARTAVSHSTIGIYQRRHHDRATIAVSEESART